MRKISALLIVAVVLCVPAAMAQELPNYFRVLNVHVDLAKAPDYEAAVKELWKTMAKAEGDFPVFASVSAYQPGHYSFAIPMASMGDYETQQAQFGKAAEHGASEIFPKLGSMAYDNESSIWRVRPDLSYNAESPRLQDAEVQFNRLAFLMPHPGKAQAFEDVLRDAAAMSKKHGIGDGFMVAQQVVGPDGPAFVVMGWGKDQADFYSQMQKNQQKMGGDWQSILQRSSGMLRDIEFTGAFRRPDLGYQP